jgi:hypothetical protein
VDEIRARMVGDRPQRCLMGPPPRRVSAPRSWGLLRNNQRAPPATSSWRGSEGRPPGPTTGVIQGMSGSPVPNVDGKFDRRCTLIPSGRSPRSRLPGITTDCRDDHEPRARQAPTCVNARGPGNQLCRPTQTEVVAPRSAGLRHARMSPLRDPPVTACGRAAGPLGRISRPDLRPIGAAVIMTASMRALDGTWASALAAPRRGKPAQTGARATRGPSPEPRLAASGPAIRSGMSLNARDMEVFWGGHGHSHLTIDGARAFTRSDHTVISTSARPRSSMTQARVHTVLEAEPRDDRSRSATGSAPGSSAPNHPGPSHCGGRRPSASGPKEMEGPSQVLVRSGNRRMSFTMQVLHESGHSRRLVGYEWTCSTRCSPTKRQVGSASITTESKRVLLTVRGPRWQDRVARHLLKAIRPRLAAGDRHCGRLIGAASRRTSSARSCRSVSISSCTQPSTHQTAHHRVGVRGSTRRGARSFGKTYQFAGPTAGTNAGAQRTVTLPVKDALPQADGR